MTTPTQAQIKQVWEYDKEELAEMYAIALCEIERLTAAAQVGEPTPLKQALEYLDGYFDDPSNGIGPKQCDLESRQKEAKHVRNVIRRAFEAAQVGEHDLPPIHVVVEQTIKEDTIERCAQVAENFRINWDDIANYHLQLAAAIRKLKDENE